MREIKFRAWCESKHRYFMPEEMAADQFTLLPTGFFINVSGTSTKLSRIFTHDEYLPEQFTGLKDDSGKEIYEGDILENINPPGMEDCITAVVWNQLEACFFVENDPCDIYEQIYNVTGYCTVIGNIHENPELLK